MGAFKIFLCFLTPTLYMMAYRCLLGACNVRSYDYPSSPIGGSGAILNHSNAERLGGVVGFRTGDLI